MSIKKPPIKILMTGFDDRTLKSFEIFYLSKCSGDYVISADDEDVPIAIIDVDAVNGIRNLQDLRKKYPEQFLLAISILERIEDDPRTVSIKKPLNHQALKKQLGNIKKAIVNSNFTTLHVVAKKGGREAAVLKNLTKDASIKPVTENVSVSHSTAAASLMAMENDLHFVGNNQDINLADKTALDKILYSPSRRYQSSVIRTVNQARKTGKIIEMICLSICIVIDPVKNIVITLAGDSLLRPICLLEVEKIDSLVEFDGSYSVDRILKFTNSKKQDLNKFSIEAFIWKIALWSSRGCLVKNIDIYTPVFLTDWPNFPRLENFPHAMRISALLIQKATMPSKVAKQLNIPQRYAFSFLSAVHALGMIRISQRNVDQVVESDTIRKKVAPQSLLKKLLGRLVGSPDKQAMAS